MHITEQILLIINYIQHFLEILKAVSRTSNLCIIGCVKVPLPRDSEAFALKFLRLLHG